MKILENGKLNKNNYNYLRLSTFMKEALQNW
jgi:hypothetical protein